MPRNYGIFVGAGLITFAVGCGGGAATPEAAFKEFQAAIKAKDGDKAWNLMSKEGQGTMNKQVEQVKEAGDAAAKSLGISADELKTLDGKKLFSLALKNPKAEEKFKEITSATLENVKVDGEKATGKVKLGSKSEAMQFVKEGGSWKLTLPDGK